jgi:hypothetical protein
MHPLQSSSCRSTTVCVYYDDDFLSVFMKCLIRGSFV